MEGKDALNKIDIKNRACYHFDDIIKVVNINLVIFHLYKNYKDYIKIFQFMTFYTKLQRFQDHYELGLIK